MISLDFKTWVARSTFAEIAVLDMIASSILSEGRKDPSVLRSRSSKSDQGNLFTGSDDNAGGRGENSTIVCHTPLSSFQKEITTIKQFAASGPEQFAQVLMFSPLSANVNFAKHWDNFPVVMTILKTMFPDVATKEGLQQAIDGFGDKYYALAGTIAGWKYDTITYVWNHRDTLYHELTAANKSGNEIALLGELVKIPGVAPVKAGFIAQLIFGKSGCLDTHNIDIYTKVFPDMKDELNPDRWKSTDGIEGIKRYADTLNKLQKRGIGTLELWDVWVDFVGRMYKMITSGGRGLYADLEPALNPNDPKYADLKTTINKMRITSAGKKTDAIVGVPTIVGGTEGGGAGATHTIAAKDPEEALKQFDLMARGHQGADWARAVPKFLDKNGLPLDRGSGDKPAMSHYFGPAISNGQVDRDRIKHIIQQRMLKGGKKAAIARTPTLF